MTHRDEQQWRAYLLDEMTDSEREQAEEHLYGCDICLARWEHVLSSLDEAVFPLMNRLRADSVTNAVMEAVVEVPVYSCGANEAKPTGSATGHGQGGTKPDEGRPGEYERRLKSRARDGERRRAFLHYAIAVCVTLLLMSTGLWKAIDAGTPASAEQHHEYRNGETALQQSDKVTYTERVMNHTVGLLEQWTEKAAGSAADSSNEKGMGS
ncbi:anti-sigma factor [Paenibacillus kobensis]|uniref:hypothetical protein n=1 Tax=Paenibacillus kobensis TaxID=59841 RepID=UPI000FDAFFB7|nr:hypothetical protein [Paenibacillus kobensis]